MKPPIESIAGIVFMLVGGFLGLASIPLGLTHPGKTYGTESIGLFLFAYGLYLLCRG
jgi:hypothetical protein